MYGFINIKTFTIDFKNNGLPHSKMNFFVSFLKIKQTKDMKIIKINEFEKGLVFKNGGYKK